MAARREAFVELARERPPDERGSVDTFGWGVEFGFDGELRGWRARVGCSFVESGRQPVRERAFVAEAGEYVGGRQCGEIAERAQAESPQHVDEVGTAERFEWQRRQERRARTRRNDDRWRARCKLGGERTVGDTDMDGDAALQHTEREPTGAFCQRFIAAEVTSRTSSGKGALSWRDHLDTRRQYVERGNDRFEAARISCWVVIDDDELGTPTL
jgi:hypothetical protein